MPKPWGKGRDVASGGMGVCLPPILHKFFGKFLVGAKILWFVGEIVSR